MKRVAAFLLCAASLLMPVEAGAEDARVLKMAISDPNNSEMGVMAKAFKKAVEEKTAGALQIELYFDGELGDETETLHNVRRGALDLACAGVANLVPFAKKLGVVSLPYIYDNADQAVAGTTGAGHDLLNAHAKEGGFKILSWVYSGFRHLSNSKHPVQKLDDVVGLKIRIPQSTVMLSMYKAWDAIPVLLAWPDVYSSLADHTVDGQCYGYSGFNSMGFIKTGQKYLTEMHHTYLLQPVVISDRMFESLSPNIQKALLEAGNEAQQVALEYIRKENENAKQVLTVQGLNIIQLDDEPEWKQIAMSTVWPEMAMFVGGKDAINAYLKILGKPDWQ